MELATYIGNAFQNLRHARLIWRSGLFQAEAYRQHYLADSRFKTHPFLHYLLIGESKGYRPNAFFDPMFFEKVAGTKHLGKYLKNRDLWDKKTDPVFDGLFYSARLSGQPPLDTAPLVDFWHHGFDACVDSSESFNMAFFRKATTRDRWDKKATAFLAMVSPDKFIFSATDLKARQDAFYGAIQMKILKECAAPAGHRNLVFVQAGAAYSADFLEHRRNFDLLLNYYEPVVDTARHCDIAVAQNGTKVTAVRKILDQRPDLFLRYDNVLFLDDDVTMSCEAIERFFEVMEREGLDLAQPSLSEDSTTYFKDLKQPLVGPGIRKVTSVEIMMPAMSRRALAECGWVFSTGISGWAVDFLLGAATRKAFSTVPAVIGECVAAHLRPFDTENGTFYRFLQSHGIDARVEAGAIALQYDIDDSSDAIRYAD